MVYFFLCGFWQIMSFKELVLFTQDTKFVSIELFTVFFYYHFDDCDICNDVPFLISEISDLWPLFIPSQPGQKFIDLIALFNEIAFGFVDFIYLFSVFNIIDFCSNFYDLFFFLPTLDLQLTLLFLAS